MRKIFFSLFLTVILFLNGCAKNKEIPLSSGSDSDMLPSSEIKLELSEDTSDTDTASFTDIIPEDTDSETENAESSKSVSDDPSNADEPSESSSNTTSSHTSDVTSDSKFTEEPMPPKVDDSHSSPDSEPEELSSGIIWTPTVYATEKDEKEIAEKVVKYINEYRVSQGTAPATQLPGLSGYAKYRSKQLVTNFAHDAHDVRTAATALKYGEYVDPSLYGLDDEPYYRPCAREAIGQSGKVGTVDEVAQHIAALFFNSPGHWAYVGSGEYPYIGIGITYEASRWYCDIAVSEENNG